MRLRWPFGRARPDGAYASSDDLPKDGKAGSGEPDAWRRLPPLGETIGPPPLIAPGGAFAAALAAENPPPILAPLSHARGLDAPSGLVVGVARPVPAMVGSGSTRVVQRAPARRGMPASVHDMTEPIDSSEARPQAEVGRLSGEPAVSAALAVAWPKPAAPARGRLPVSDPAVGLVARSLSRSGGGVAIAPSPVGVIREARSSAMPANISDGAIQRAPLPAAASAPVALSAPPSPTRAASADSAPRPAMTPSSEAPLSVGQVRRLGLGAPLTGGPVTSVTPPTVAARAVAQRASFPHATGSLATPVAPSPTLPAPSGPDVVRPAPLPPPPTVRATALASGRPSPSSTADRPSVPTVATRPLQAGVQRAPMTALLHPAGVADAPDKAGPAVAGASGSAPSADGSVTVHRGATATDLSTALQARAFTTGGEVYLPASHGPLNAGPAKSLLAHELTHVVQQRRLGSSLPNESSSHGGALEAEAVAAERSGSLPLATPFRPTKRDEPETPVPTAAAQRAPIAPPPATAALSAPPADITETVRLSTAAQRAPTESAGRAGANPAPTTGSRQRSEKELEDLAGQLYARIGNRLRRELLVDRERAGLVMDRT